MDFPGSSGKESACQCRRHKRRKFSPWLGTSPGGGHGTQVLLPGKCYGQRSLAGYSP